MFSIKKILILSSLILTTQSFALPQDSRRAGGIAVITVPKTVLNVSYQGKPVLVVDGINSVNHIVFGIPLSAQVGNLELQSSNGPINIEVQPYKYAEQRLNVKTRITLIQINNSLIDIAKKPKSKMTSIPHLAQPNGKISQI